MMARAQSIQEVVEASVAKVLDEREEKRSVYSFSDLNSELGQRIKNKLRLRDDYLHFDEPENTSVEGYQWIPELAESHEDQRAACMRYLRHNLKSLLDQGGFQLEDIANDKSLLSIVDPRLPFRMIGTADVLLVNRKSKWPSNKLAGISIVIELKHIVKEYHSPQAMGQLASCSLKAPIRCYPLSLLTDLNNHWYFSWFSEDRTLAHVDLKYPKNAIDFIVAAVSNKESSAPFRVPFIGPPLKKLKVDDFFPMPSDGADEMMERYELMADELEPEFLAEKRMEYAQHLVQSMLMYAHIHNLEFDHQLSNFTRRLLGPPLLSGIFATVLICQLFISRSVGCCYSFRP
ncbi:unnamed protein product [Phytophthora lilii]|uniref:Unnamed protein product n=1 Tax=Phytophthora lilii TaxID=2077276 RepID=A0A9W6X2M9_9STRA|nr:unnamed protein product [Phytophthora lilii]